MAKHKKFSNGWARAHGAVVPADASELMCPVCWGESSIHEEPFIGDRIFKCQCCNADVVVLRIMGEETCVLLEDLDDPTELATYTSVVGDDTYNPKPLVELFNGT